MKVQSIWAGITWRAHVELTACVTYIHSNLLVGLLLLFQMLCFHADQASCTETACEALQLLAACQMSQGAI